MDKLRECFKDYKISYSYGIADYISYSGEDINDSIRMADYDMYEMKTAYKLGHRKEYGEDDRIKKN